MNFVDGRDKPGHDEYQMRVTTEVVSDSAIIPKRNHGRANVRLGIDLGGTKIEAAVLGRDGGIVARRRVPTPAGDYRATVMAIVDLVGALEIELGAQCSVGIAIPGAISPATGLVKNANSTCLIGHQFDRDLEAALGRPVRLANDANCFALSEAVDGAPAAALWSAAGC